MDAQVAVGQWRAHLPYNHLIAVTEGDNKIFAATPYSLFYLDKTDFSIERINSVNALNDVNVTAINFHDASSTLIIGYQNGNIDLWRDGHVINVSDIKRKNIIGGKQINTFHFIDKYAYIGTQFGIVVYDLQALEVSDTWYIGPNGSKLVINDFQHNDTAFFAATNDGFYWAPLTGVNHAFYENWEKDTLLIYPDNAYNSFCFYNEKIIINLQGDTYGTDTLYMYENGSWNYFDVTFSGPNNNLHSFGDTLVIAGAQYRYYYDDLQKSFIVYDYAQDPAVTIPYAMDAYFDKQGVLWTADAYQGLVFMEREWLHRIIIPEGPAYINGFAMDCQNEDLWVVSGGVTSNWSNNYEAKGLYHFKDQEWASFNRFNMDAFDTIPDVVSIAVHPTRLNRAYVGTWGRGVMEFDNGKLTNIFDTTNSTLQDASNWDGFVGVGGLAFDEDNNLWVSNTANGNALSVYTSDKKWHSMNLAPHVNEQVVGPITIDQQGQKWVILPNGGGIVVFDEQEDLDDKSDDLVKKLSTALGKGQLPSNFVYSLAVDRDNEIWIGTSEGVAVIYSPENVFREGADFDAQQVYVAEVGISQYLLESESVTAIAVDGANNKWFGTRNAGVFYMSADGTEQIYHFNEENSPLLNDNVMSICIDHVSGEVFFGTESGIISFRGTATKGAETHENVKVFPNPVRPNYDGYITISGLVEDAAVKITDIAGNLVYEMTSLGGTAVWDGKTPDGEKVSTGVYLVFSTNVDGSQTAVAKILFVR